MFGFLRSVADNSESEVDTFQKHLQNELDALKGNATRAEASARKGAAGTRVVRRVNNVRALSDTEASDTEGDEEDRIVDFVWDFKFAKVGDDPEFWQKQYVPHTEEVLDNPAPRPRGLRGDVERSDRLLSSRQRLLDRQMRRMHHEQRREAALKLAAQQHTTVAPTQQIVPVETTQSWQSSLLSNATTPEGILRQPATETTKKASRVSFAPSTTAQRRVGLQRYFPSAEPESDDDDDEEEEEEQHKYMRHSNQFEGMEVSEAERISEGEEEEDEEEEEPVDHHQCGYCRGNPYRKITTRGVFHSKFTTSSGLPFLSSHLAAQHAKELPHGCRRALRKAHTTAFAKGVERVLLALKRGVNLTVPRVDAGEDATGIVEDVSFNAAMRARNISLQNNHFKLCVDNAFAYDTCSKDTSRVSAENVYLPTKYGVVLAVKDRYAVSVVIALAQFHFVNARLISLKNDKATDDSTSGPVFVEDNKRVIAVAGGADVSVGHQPTLLSTFSHAIASGFPYQLLLTANTGFCTCQTKVHDNVEEDVSTTDSRNEGKIFTKARMFDLGLLDVEYADQQDYTYIVPHSFTLNDLFVE